MKYIVLYSIFTITPLMGMKDNLENLYKIWKEYGIPHNKEECLQFIIPTQKAYEALLHDHSYTQKEIIEHFNESLSISLQKVSQSLSNNQFLDFQQKIEQSYEKCRALVDCHFHCFNHNEQSEPEQKMHTQVIHNMLSLKFFKEIRQNTLNALYLDKTAEEETKK